MYSISVVRCSGLKFDAFLTDKVSQQRNSGSISARVGDILHNICTQTYSFFSYDKAVKGRATILDGCVKIMSHFSIEVENDLKVDSLRGTVQSALK